MSKPLVLSFDFESYYDTEYSLTRMAPPNYILDPRFETIGCSFKENACPAVFVDGPDIPEFLRRFDPAVTTTVAFNALFDNCILAWVYGFVPARMLCTMRMAVALRGHLLPSASLTSVGRLLGVGTKGTTIESARGKHRVDGMSEIVLELKRRNWSNEKIGKQLGMDPDEVLRLAQITGLAEMFADREFSQAWEADAINEDDTLSEAING